MENVYDVSMISRMMEIIQLYIAAAGLVLSTTPLDCISLFNM